MKPFWNAELQNDLGNLQYKRENYNSALHNYTRAIDVNPNSAKYLGNRSACFIQLKRYREAFVDARKCVFLDSKFTKGWLRMALCCILLGDSGSAELALFSASQTNSTVYPSTAKLEMKLKNLKRFEKEMTEAYSKKNYSETLVLADEALQIATESTILRIRKAECLVFLHQLHSAQKLVDEILSRESYNADAVYIQGICLYYQDDDEEALAQFRTALKLDPEHAEARSALRTARRVSDLIMKGNLDLEEEKGKQKTREQHMLLEAACRHFTEALDIVDPNKVNLIARVYWKRAQTLSKMGKTVEALGDLSTATTLDEDFLQPLIARARLLMLLGDYEEAIQDCKQILKKHKSPDNEVRLMMAEAEKAMKNLKPNYYDVLGIVRNATESMIRKAFKQLALQHHPDRHMNAHSFEVKRREKKFKLVLEAYNVLADPNTRAQYDKRQNRVKEEAEE